MRQYILVNTDLNMSPGKVAAQVAHATSGLILTTKRKPDASQIEDWFLFHGQRKIVCGMNQQELLDTIDRLKQERIAHYAVYDSGKTEVAPRSLTGVAIFPFLDAQTPRWFKSFRTL